jgi:hypothetical protein
MFVADFSEIPGWTIETHNAAHDMDLRWLNNEVEGIARLEPARKILIFTHYSPTTKPWANSKVHLQDAMEIRSAFVTDLSKETCWKSSQVVLWAFGHTHFNCDAVDEDTNKRVLTNQKGYRRSESLSFNPNFMVSFESAKDARLDPTI